MKKENLMKCTKCELYKTSKAGITTCVKLMDIEKPDAVIMIVGEAPGFNEILNKQLFVGNTGSFLTQALKVVGIKKDEVYFTNIIKCRPPQNRTPKLKEIKACSPYLEEEINKIKPKVICCLGNTSTEYFLKQKGIKKLRGVTYWNDKYNCYIIPTYHPSYLLRFSKYAQVIKDFYSDLKLVLDITKNKRKENRTKCSVANTLNKIEKVKKYLLNKKEFAFDTETTSLNALKSKVLCVSFSSKEGEGIIIPFQDDRIFNLKEQEIVKKQLQEIFNSDILKITQNGKFDIKHLSVKGINTKNLYFDTLIAHYLINENIRHTLDFLTSIYTTMQNYKDEIGDYIKGNIKIEEDGKKRKSTILDAPIDKLYMYAAKDADATLRVYKKLNVILKEQNLDRLFYKIVMPVVTILVEMELTGILVDKDYLKKAAEQFLYKIKMLEKELVENKDVKNYCIKREKNSFNFKSPKQLSELLFEDMNLKPVKLTDKGKASTDKDTLEVLAKKHKNKFLTSINNYRKLQKFYKTYIFKYLELANNSLDNKLHTNYKFHGTKTGRFSSSNPNLQNIPKHGGGDKLIRRCFISRPGHTFLEADYSQLEFRIFAHCSKDKDLIKIASEEDIHTTMASKIFNLPLDKVSKEQRSMAKAAVFGGIMYGGGPSIIVRNFGASFQKAERIINDFFNNFPTAYNYIINEKKFVKKYGYVVNLFNRRRRLDGVFSNVDGVKKVALRQAINAPIQGGGADVVLIAMQKVAKEIKDIDCTLLLNIHDALIFEIENSILKETIIRIKKVMEKPVNLRVPLVVTTEIGTNLGEMKEIKITS